MVPPAGVGGSGDRLEMVFDCFDYLGTALPAAIREGVKPAPPRSVVLQLIVADLDGCEFVYRFDEDTGLEVRRGLADDVDLTVAFVSRDLEAFSKARFDVAHALGTKRLKVMGDHSLLEWLAAELHDDRRMRS